MKHFENIVFPPNCRGILDVTKPPYCVDNTGKIDCTETLCRIIDDLMDSHIKAMQEVYQYLQNAPDGTYISVENRRVSALKIWAVMPNEMIQTPVIYFPNGTYLVSDTVSYRSRNLHNMMYHYQSGGFEMNRCIRFMGQSRDKTVIKLQDHCKGFEYGQERPVINFMLSERSNISMSNYFENLTLDTGIGNPGAVGILFFANNSGAVRNVTIRSGDGDGAVGLLIRNEVHSACNVYNTQVDGFTYGVRVNTYRTFAYFENLTLNNQLRYGIMTDNTALQLIGVKSHNNVPVLCVSCNSICGHIVLVNGDFTSDGTNYAAIKMEFGGILFARNVRTKGFSYALERNWMEKTLPDGYIDEYCSADTYTLFDSEAKSLALPISPVPDLPRENDFSQWCCVNDFGAVGDGKTDDTESIRAAFASGKPVIWFQPGHYLITSPIDIPATVDHVHFMYCDILAGEELSMSSENAVFHIKGESSKTLLVEKMLAWNECIGNLRMFRHDSTRRVFMRDMHTQACAFYCNSVPGAEVFFENCACTVGKKLVFGHVPAFSFKGQTVWCHCINPERSMIETENIGGQLWWSGFKTEQEGSINVTREGGVTEILGGVAVAGAGVDRPLILNDNSTVSAIFATAGYHSYSGNPVAVTEIRGNETRQILDSQLPERGKPFYFMPLYSGRNS